VLGKLAEKEEPKLEVTVVGTSRLLSLPFGLTDFRRCSGPIDEKGESLYAEESDFSNSSSFSFPSSCPFSPALPSSETDAIVAQHSSSLRLVPRCHALNNYEFGSVTTIPSPGLKASEDDPNRRDYLISYGPCFFVMSSALPILLLATQGRMTMERLWLLGMKQGKNDNCAGYVLADVDYGDITDSIDQFWVALPGLSTCDEEEEKRERVKEWVEAAETDEELLQTVVHEGGYWMWMSPVK
jgi:hypothetical protein